MSDVFEKKCRICKDTKSIEKMVINHTTPVKVHYKDICKDCANKKTKLVSALKKENLYPDGDYSCPICKSKSKKYYLDHSWENKEFRGWLCNACNVALGLLKDNIKILNNAIKYLEK
jgi:hypothetical protein